MSQSYRFGPKASYAWRVARASLPIVALASLLAACSEERPIRSSIVSVGERLPAHWPSPHRSQRAAAPQIEAIRFSTLDLPLGSRWNGDAIATLDTTSVDVKTNLFDFAMPQTSPGHFHFAVDMLDLPAFLVRPYALHVVARDSAGRESTLVVPFRIRGRV